MSTPGPNQPLYILPSIFEKAREAEQDEIDAETTPLRDPEHYQYDLKGISTKIY